MPDTVFGLKSLAAMVTALLSASCALNDRTTAAPRTERKLYDWHDDGAPGKVCIRISLPDQIATIQRGGRDIGWCYVATGKEGHGTQAGSYQIMEKIVDKHSNRYGWIEDELGNVVDGDAQPGDRVPEGMVYVPASMPYWMRITSYGIGMHGGLIPEPGKPASHGCIRMPKAFVSLLFNSVQVGTPVIISCVSHRRDPREESPVTQKFDGNSRVIETRPLSKAESRSLAPHSTGE